MITARYCPRLVREEGEPAVVRAVKVGRAPNVDIRLEIIAKVGEDLVLPCLKVKRYPGAPPPGRTLPAVTPGSTPGTWHVEPWDWPVESGLPKRTALRLTNVPEGAL